MSERPPRLPDEEPATPGAQRQIDALQHRMNNWTRALMVAGVLWVVGGLVTGLQINRAFDKLEEERIERIGAASSVTAYLCEKIDDVGDGVGALVAVTLQDAPKPEELSADDRRALDLFTEYLEEQEEPPRCREVALELARLTGADPEHVHITPLKVELKDKAANERRQARREKEAIERHRERETRPGG